MPGGGATAPVERRTRPGWAIPLAAAAGVVLLAGVPAALLVGQHGSSGKTGSAAAGAPNGGGQGGVPQGTAAGSPSPGRASGSASPGQSGTAGTSGKKKAKKGSTLAGGPSAPALGPNLVVGGGFENGLTPWAKSRGDTTVVTSPKYAGAHAVRVNVKQGTGLDATAEQVVTGLKPRTDYVLDGWVKSDGGVTYLGVKLYNAKQSASRTTTATGWTELTSYFTTGAGNTTAQIWCYRPSVSAGHTAGTGYCDGISVRENSA
jgi:hypothetical protein